MSSPGLPRESTLQDTKPFTSPPEQRGLCSTISTTGRSGRRLWIAGSSPAMTQEKKARGKDKKAAGNGLIDLFIQRIKL